MGSFGRIMCVNLKHNFGAPFVSAAVIVILTFLLFNVTGLKGNEAAKPIEFFLCWVGVMFLTPIFLPEQDRAIQDVICSKKTDYLKVCVIRVFYSVIATSVMIALFAGIMKISESEMDMRYLFGGIATALFLGALGFAVSGLSGNTTAGYMAVTLYYLANYGLKEKLGRFYLFSMSAGSFTEKWWLLAGAAVFIAVTFAVMKVRQKFS